MVREENYVCIDQTLKELNIGGKVCVLVFLLVLLEKNNSSAFKFTMGLRFQVQTPDH